MTDLFVNRAANYFGGVGEADENIQTASGSVIVGLTGDLGASGAKPGLTVYSKNGAATVDYDPTYRQNGLGRQVLDLATGDEYYCRVTNVRPDMLLDLSVADV